jgi:hypothetical protein
MSRLTFNGNSHQISLVDNNGRTVGTWAAYNNVDSHATLNHVNNGTYNIQDTTTPHQHRADPNGPYGSHGIVRFNVAGHPGIGVHSGRANARHQPGPLHATMGCIRTTDEAMAAIASHARTSPLTTIEVSHNSAPAARTATQRHRNRPLQGAQAQ